MAGELGMMGLVWRGGGGAGRFLGQIEKAVARSIQE